MLVQRRLRCIEQRVGVEWLVIAVGGNEGARGLCTPRELARVQDRLEGQFHVLDNRVERFVSVEKSIIGPENQGSKIGGAES